MLHEAKRNYPANPGNQGISFTPIKKYKVVQSGAKVVQKWCKSGATPL
jgi:hypothetical protein